MIDTPAQPPREMSADVNHVHICWTDFTDNKITVQHCPTCKQDARFLCRFQEWYGWNVTCLQCGDSWNDGELSPRPFMRGWRKLAIEAANNKARELGLI